jgi:hypothetical protein
VRVDYISPAVQPGVSTELPESSGAAPSFREQVRISTLPLPLSWEQQLRLDVRPFTTTYIGPPPRPSTLGLDDVQTQRMRWHNILPRHSGASSVLQDSIATPGEQAVQTMLEMISQIQQMEDAIVSRQVAVTRG